MNRIRILLFVLLIMFCIGCTTVQPWERESLSSPIMIFDKNPIEKGIKIHHIEFREGSAGATGSQSGGCGCG
ncbi:MAG: arginine decarboxylase [Ignavibacteria bacterium GWB2_35_12]|nr:MAG: arginine decarboxylase [Ignavibacteria bacterium GWA2_35_8]OGU40095.1 MAG: arginine decarboxylase [Ignavibacteria bacterium GWB2_35_12]OGU87412.1 MAG: arginine decarboxylase [Ignavibacteria bacterium RIFOXYA2_FULL_35_10]OGV22025.1 MAG: arginine decarboxylase [Ignavibacteria bacterium RIFOXYC2_FULL_35_21]